jgi:hypothetical protein
MGANFVPENEAAPSSKNHILSIDYVNISIDDINLYPGNVDKQKVRSRASGNGRDKAPS